MFAYHFGAVSASGQTGEIADIAEIDADAYMAVSGRVIYQAQLRDFPGSLVSHRVLSPVPGASRIVAVTRGPFVTWVVMLEDGDCYYSNTEGTAWTRSGNVFGSPTPAQHESWGSMKSRYRGERGAAQPTTQDH